MNATSNFPQAENPHLNKQPFSLADQQQMSFMRNIRFDISGTRKLRQELLDLGQQMVSAGVIEESTDIFFLSPDAVSAARSRLQGSTQTK